MLIRERHLFDIMDQGVRAYSEGGGGCLFGRCALIRGMRAHSRGGGCLFKEIP